jgi:hypothetical protein
MADHREANSSVFKEEKVNFNIFYEFSTSETTILNYREIMLGRNLQSNLI